MIVEMSLCRPGDGGSRKWKSHLPSGNTPGESAGIHLVVASIKAIGQCHYRTYQGECCHDAFSVSSGVDSEPLSTMNGAETVGKRRHAIRPISGSHRVQGPLLRTRKWQSVVEYLPRIRNGDVKHTMRTVNTSSAAGMSGDLFERKVMTDVAFAEGPHYRLRTRHPSGCCVRNV